MFSHELERADKVVIALYHFLHVSNSRPTWLDSCSGCLRPLRFLRLAHSQPSNELELVTDHISIVGLG